MSRWFELKRIPPITEILAEHGDHKLRRNNSYHELYDLCGEDIMYVGKSKSDESDVERWRVFLEGLNEW